MGPVNDFLKLVLNFGYNTGAIPGIITPLSFFFYKIYPLYLPNDLNHNNLKDF